MDFLVNNIENVKNVKMDQPKVEKKKVAESAALTKSKNDSVELSNEVKTFNNQLEEAKNYLKDLEDTKTLSDEEIKKFQGKVKKYSKNFDSVEDNIVYSIMTLPAFQDIGSVDTEKSSKISNEIEEIKRIQEELGKGGEVEEVLEEAIKFLMKSLLS